MTDFVVTPENGLMPITVGKWDGTGTAVVYPVQLHAWVYAIGMEIRGLRMKTNVTKAVRSHLGMPPAARCTTKIRQETLDTVKWLINEIEKESA